MSTLRLKMFGWLTVAILMASSVTVTPQAHAAGYQVTYFKAEHSGLCTDAAGNGNANGTKIQQWSCNGTGAQKWELVYVASGPNLYGRAGNYYAIRKQGTNMCIDISGGATWNGANAHLWTCHKGANQQFLFYDHFWTWTPKMSIINRNSRKCLDVFSWSRSSGGQIGQWDCNFNANQRFYWNGK